MTCVHCKGMLLPDSHERRGWTCANCGRSPTHPPLEAPKGTMKIEGQDTLRRPGPGRHPFG
jgi:hypothetical protein